MACVVMNAGGGQLTVNFDTSDLAQRKHMTEKANTLVAKRFPEEIVVTQSNYPICPGEPHT